MALGACDASAKCCLNPVNHGLALADPRFKKKITSYRNLCLAHDLEPAHTGSCIVGWFREREFMARRFQPGCHATLTTIQAFHPTSGCAAVG